MNDKNEFKWTLVANVVQTAVVPDSIEDIQRVVTDWADKQSVDVVLTTGGTGFGRRDFTPEAITPLLHRHAPGVAQALVNEGLQFTPLAALSRPVVGTRHNTLIATLPGR
jgi:gephyrin